MKITFQEKGESEKGRRVRAVGMKFYTGVDLKLGITYTMRRRKDNKKDTNCLEIMDGTRAKAVINRDVAKVLSPLFDKEKLCFAEW